MYSSDYDDLYPWAVDPADQFLPQIWASYPAWQAMIPTMPRLKDALMPYTKNRQIWKCRSDKGFTVLEGTGLALDGTPTAFDRVLGTRLGVVAADLAVAGTHGVMVAARGSDIVPVPLDEACSDIRGVDEATYDVAQTFFG